MTTIETHDFWNVTDAEMRAMRPRRGLWRVIGLGMVLAAPGLLLMPVDTAGPVMSAIRIALSLVLLTGGVRLMTPARRRSR